MQRRIWGDWCAAASEEEGQGATRLVTCYLMYIYVAKCILSFLQNNVYRPARTRAECGRLELCTRLS